VFLTSEYFKVWGSDTCSGKRFRFSPNDPDRPWEPSRPLFRRYWRILSEVNWPFNGVYRNNFYCFLVVLFFFFPLANCYVATFKSILQQHFNIFLHHVSLFCVLMRKMAQKRKASVVGRFMSRPEHRLLWLMFPWCSADPTDSADLVH
jgi:hypothetical protein